MPSRMLGPPPKRENESQPLLFLIKTQLVRTPEALRCCHQDATTEEQPSLQASTTVFLIRKIWKELFL